MSKVPDLVWLDWWYDKETGTWRLEGYYPTTLDDEREHEGEPYVLLQEVGKVPRKVEIGHRKGSNIDWELYHNMPPAEWMRRLAEDD